MSQPNPQRTRIIELAATGMNGGQIAKALNVTRNTVIGICWRTGVPLGDQKASYRAKLAWWEKGRRDARIHQMQVDMLGVRRLMPERADSSAREAGP